MTLSHAAGSGRHPLADRGADFYATPPAAVHALLQVETLPHTLWEPACGGGAIVKVLRDAGHEVYASDLHDWGCLDSQVGVDFMTVQQAPDGVGAIVTNPPYKIAAAFVEHALQLCPLVVMLLRLAFIESKRRAPLLDGGMLARIHVFADRLPFMHRHDWAGPRASSAIAFAWFVWEANHRGPTTLDRISRRAPPRPRIDLGEVLNGYARAQQKFHSPPVNKDQPWQRRNS